MQRFKFFALTGAATALLLGGSTLFAQRGDQIITWHTRFGRSENLHHGRDTS